jgi:hypothetical protein
MATNTAPGFTLRESYSTPVTGSSDPPPTPTEATSATSSFQVITSSIVDCAWRSKGAGRHRLLLHCNGAPPVCIDDHLRKIPYQLNDDDGANQDRDAADRSVDIAQDFAEAGLIEQGVLEQDGGMIAGGEQHRKRNQSDGLDNNIFDGLRPLPSSPQKALHVPAQLHDVDRNAAPENLYPDRRQLERGHAQVSCARAHEQIRMLRNQQQPGQKEETKDQFGNGLGIAARLLSIRCDLLHRRQRRGRPFAGRQGKPFELFRALLYRKLQTNKNQRDPHGGRQQNNRHMESRFQQGISAGNLAAKKLRRNYDRVNDRRP